MPCPNDIKPVLIRSNSPRITKPLQKYKEILYITPSSFYYPNNPNLRRLKKEKRIIEKYPDVKKLNRFRWDRWNSD